MTDHAACTDYISLSRRFHSLIPPRQERHIDRRIIRKHPPLEDHTARAGHFKSIPVPTDP